MVEMARILSIDDSLTIRNMVKSMLESEGFEVVSANDGVDAMEIAREQTFDLVLSDINMPNMNGISLVSKLRRLDAYADTPIIMLTTEESDFKKNKAKNFGASGWLQEPFTEERLVGAVKKILG
jgi:two-component system chemotaxis response regulator CheY